MSGMGDGYVGTAQDAVRIRKLEKQREAERRKIQELKNKTACSKGQPGLLQFGSSTSEILETVFKEETVGLVTREEYVEKRVNIRSKIEEEEKEKLQKLQQEEEELQLQKLKKREVKVDPRLSFCDDIENSNEEEDVDNMHEAMARNKRQEQIPEVVVGNDEEDENQTLANIADAANRRIGRQVANNPPPAPRPIPVLSPEISNVLNSMNQIIQSQQQMIQDQQRLIREQEECQHRREVGVPVHFERLKRNNIPMFDGKLSPEDSEYWLKDLESHFKILQTPENVKAVVVEQFLLGDAKEWWKGMVLAYTGGNQPLTWEVFRRVFLENYFPVSLRRKKESEFFKLEQTDDMTVVEYAKKFNSLGQYVPDVMSNEERKLQWFEEGLHGRIKARLSAVEPTSYAECFRKAIKIESDIQRCNTERGAKRTRSDFTLGHSSK